ncbi:MAG: TonB-dependent receptor [Alphaproteobacteria bacterium]|nr:TonB-dependent receptor [Alphaproteobacteria bacterium]
MPPRSRTSRTPVRALLPLLLLAPAALPVTLSLVSLPASAADLTGQLRGEVVDGDGIGVPGVVVNITGDNLQGGRSIETDIDGAFRVLALPPGDYRVEALKPGFNGAISTVPVSAGRTSSIQLVLALQEAGEEIVIIEQKPTVDVTSTRTGAVLTKEMLRDIPNAGRDYQSAMALSPGVVGSGNANMRGGVDNSNQFFIDGVNTTDPLTGTFSNNMNFDAIEEIQVITGGMDAEWGRSLGGALNIVTRSGGNDFEGDVQLLYSSKATRIYKPLPEENADDLEYFDMQGALNVGGPIVKDRLWFFTSLAFLRFDYEESVPAEVDRPVPMAPRYWNSFYWFGKLTWRPHTDHKIWLQAQGDPSSIENSTQDIYTLPSGEEWWRQGGWLASIGHEWTPTSRSILETQLYTQSSYIHTRPVQELWCKRGQWDQCDEGSNYGYEASWFSNSGWSYGPEPYYYDTQRYRHSLNSAFTQLFDALGEHEAKAGVNAELIQSFSAFPGLGPWTAEDGPNHPRSGLVYWEPTGDEDDLDSYEPSTMYLYNTNQETTLAGLLFAAYIQDVWNPWPRLTLRPGVRLDYSSLHLRGFLDAEYGDTKVFSTVNVAPRMGAAYDLTGDGRTSVHAYYGRFYDPGYLEIASILSDTDGGYTTYNWDGNNDQWLPGGESSSSLFLVADDLKTPRSDEFDIGISRDVGDGWGLDLNFVYEAFRNRWEDDEVNLIWNDEGTDVIGGRNGKTEAIYRLRTPDEVFTNYTSMEFTANRQFDEHWGMVGSYTYSRTYGFLQGNDASLASGAFDNPTQNEVDVGLQPYDIPHSFKVAGSYRDPEAIRLGKDTELGFLFGWNVAARSGYPYRKLYYNNYYGDWSNAKDPIDGTYRLQMFTKTDLKAGLTLDVGRTTWDLTAECFNVFNDRTVTSVDTRYGAADGQGVLVDSDDEPYWQRVTARQNPRYFQFGLRGEFN